MGRHTFVTEAALFEATTHKSDIRQSLSDPPAGMGRSANTSAAAADFGSDVARHARAWPKGEAMVQARPLGQNAAGGQTRMEVGSIALTSGAFVAMWRDRVDTLYPPIQRQRCGGRRLEIDQLRSPNACPNLLVGGGVSAILGVKIPNAGRFASACRSCVHRSRLSIGFF